MRAGLTFSIVGHAFVFLCGVIAAPSLLQDEAKPVNNILVELIPISEESKLRLGSKVAEENLKVAAPAPSEVETDNPIDAPNDENAALNTHTESAREATHVEELDTEQISSESQLELVEIEKEQGAPEPKSEEIASLPKDPVLNVLPRPKAKNVEPKKSTDGSEIEQSDQRKPVEVKNQSESTTFDLNEVATLLNKTDKTIGSDRKSEAKASIGQFKEQEVAKLTVSETDLLKNHIGSCWRQLSGAEDTQNIIVKVEIELGRLGDVENFKILNESNGQLYRAAANRAKNAVFRCAPYQMLPADKFSQWKNIVFTFNPKELVSG